MDCSADYTVVFCADVRADVPSFVSNDYIVLFDPHTKYVPGVNAAQPGEAMPLVTFPCRT